MDRKIILEILYVLVMVFSAVLVRYIIPCIKELVEWLKMQKVIKWAERAVSAAQQVHKSKPGEER